MKRKFLVLISLLVAFVLVFAACAPATGDIVDNGGNDTSNNDNNGTNNGDNGNTDNSGCQHTFNTNAWASDATSHWHQATCEHGEIKDSLAAHTDANEDGLCDVCEYEIGHEHSYASEWSSDETKHWKAAICTHTTEKLDEALHADDDKNGACDVCAAHVHTLDDTGYCTGCNKQIEELDKDDLEVVITALLAGYNKVVSGSVDYENVIVGSSNITLSHKVDYVLGTDGIYTKRTQGTVTDEIWSVLKGEEVSSIRVEKNDGTLVAAEPNAADTDSLIGYFYAVSTLANGYGAEDILETLYALAKSTDAPETETNNTYKVSNYAETHTEGENKYAFSYDILTINYDVAEGEPANVNFYKVAVDFSYNDEFVLTSLNIKCDCYTNSLADESQHDYTWDEATETITMKDTATADTYTFAVTQTAGTKAPVDMTAADAFIPDRFELQIGGEVVTEITLSPNFDEANPWPDVDVVCPEGTFIKFVKNEITRTVYIKGTETVAEGALIVSLVGDVLQVMPVNKTYGEYTVVIALGEFSASFDVIVDGVKPDDTVKGEYSFTFTATDNNTFYDQKYTFTAEESGTYTFYIPAGFGAFDGYEFEYGGFSSRPYVDPNGNGGQFSVEIAAGETYEFYLSCPMKNVEYTFTYDFVAHDVEVDDDDDQGETGSGATLQVGDNTVIFTVTEIEAGSAQKTLTVEVTGRYEFNSSELFFNVKDSTGATLAKVDYKYIDLVAGETYTVEFSMFAMINTKPNTNYSFQVVAPATDDEGDDGEGDEITVVTGTYTGTDMYGNALLTVTVTETTVTFTFDHPMFGSSEATYTYVVNGGAVILYDEENNVLNPMAGDITIDANGTPIAADYNGNSYTLAVGGDDEGGEGEGGEAAGTEGDPIAITLPATDLAVEGDSIGYLWYTFTTNEAGTITIEYSNANSWVRIMNVADAEDSNSGYEKLSFTFKVKANSTYKLGLGVWGPEEGVTASITFTVSEGGDEEGTDIVASEIIYEGDENSVAVTADDIAAGKLYLQFMAFNTGEYIFYSNDLFVTAVYDENGTALERNDNYNFELEEWCTYFVEASTSYLPGAGDYTITPEYQYPEGHQYNPIYLMLDDATIANYAGGYAAPIWYYFYAPTTGQLVIKNASGINTVVLMACAQQGSEITNVTYDENDMPVSYGDFLMMDVVQGRMYYVAVCADNTTEPVEITFTASIKEGGVSTDGTVNAPHNIEMGSNVAIYEENPVWYAYKFEATGTLTLTTPSDNCYWYILDDLAAEPEFVENGSLSIEGYEGQWVYVSISTLNWNPDKVEFIASFKGAPTENYAYANEGINKVEVAENSYTILTFNGNGKYTVTWDDPYVKVELLSWYDDNTVLASGDIIEGTMYSGVNLQISFPDYAQGSMAITITPYVEETTETGLEIGDNALTIKDAQMGDSIALPVNEDETVTYIITVGANGVVVTASYEALFEGSTYEVTVPAGETVYVTIGAYSWSDNVANINVAVKEDNGNQGGSGNAETTTLKFVVPEISSMFANSEVQKVEIAASGKYVISATGYDNILNTRLQYYDAASDTWVTIARTPGHDTHVIPYSIELSAGDVLQIRLQCWNAADAGTDIVVTVAPAA